MESRKQTISTPIDDRARALAVDADFAEAEEDAATGLRTAETRFGAEVREHHDLVDLALHGLIVGTGENSVRDDLALRVQSGLKQQRRRAGIIGGSGTPWKRKWREAFEARGLNEIQGE